MWIRSSPVAQHLSETPLSHLPCPSTAPGQLESQVKEKDTEQKTQVDGKKIRGVEKEVDEAANLQNKK